MMNYTTQLREKKYRLESRSVSVFVSKTVTVIFFERWQRGGN